MPFSGQGDVPIRYEEAGSGFLLFLVHGGGLNSRANIWRTAVFNSMWLFKDEFRCITMGSAQRERRRVHRRHPCR